MWLLLVVFSVSGAVQREEELHLVVDAAEGSLEARDALRRQVSRVSDVVVASYVYQALRPYLVVLADFVDIESRLSDRGLTLTEGSLGPVLAHIVLDLLVLREHAVPESPGPPVEFVVIDPLAAQKVAQDGNVCRTGPPSHRPVGMGEVVVVAPEVQLLPAVAQETWQVVEADVDGIVEDAAGAWEEGLVGLEGLEEGAVVWEGGAGGVEGGGAFELRVADCEEAEGGEGRGGGGGGDVGGQGKMREEGR